MTIQPSTDRTHNVTSVIERDHHSHCGTAGRFNMGKSCRFPSRTQTCEKMYTISGHDLINMVKHTARDQLSFAKWSVDQHEFKNLTYRHGKNFFVQFHS
jgi:hypothetical protein